MNIAHRVSKEEVAGVSVVSDAAALQCFRDPGCAAALWHRQMPRDVADWLSRLDADLLPRGRVVVRPDSVGKTVDQWCTLAGTPVGPQRDWLMSDIAAMADSFAAVLASPYVRLRLDVVTTNACRKFHVDAIIARLVCTYRGTGTQYGTSLDGEDPTHISTVPTGSPILLRGKLWAPQPSRDLLHRSPPIEGTGESRLLLVLDPVSELDADL